MKEERTLDISWGTIFKIALTFLSFYILFLIKDILIWIIFALIISILLNPAIDLLQKRISRLLAVTFVYVAIFGFFAFLIYLITPFFITEIQQFTQLFPQYFEKISPPLRGLGIKAFESFEIFVQSFQGWLIKISANILTGIITIFGGIFSAISIFSLAIFLSLEEKGVEGAIKLLVPKEQEDLILDLWNRSEKKAVYWFGTRVLSSLAVGLMTFFTCYILNMKYKTFFGFLAGTLDVIPIIGPTVAGTIIFIFSVLDSPLKALFFLIAFILIQQIEGNILTPALTKKFVGLPSFLILVALMIGGRLGGILGAVLSIPLTAMVFEFSKEFLKERKEKL